MSSSVKCSYATSAIIDNALQEQVKRDDSNKSSFVSELIEFLLLSKLGQQLKTRAIENNQTLLQELEDSLNTTTKILSSKELKKLAEPIGRSTNEVLEEFLLLLFETIPIDKLLELSKKSQRPPSYFLIHLVSLGLQLYERHFFSFDKMIKELKVDLEEPE